MGDLHEKLRAGLLSGTATDPEKIELLRELVAAGNTAPVRELLRAALALPANQKVLPFLVRACASVRAAELLPDIQALVAQPDEVLALNALKAAVALDTAAAVRVAAPVIRSSRPELAWGLARILTQRCPAEARAFFHELIYAHDAKDRVTSLVYLRSLPAEESTPVVIRMLAGEPEPDVAALLLRFLGKKLIRGSAGPFEVYTRDLEARLAAAQGLLASIPEQLPAARETPAGESGKATEPDELKDVLAGDVTTALAQELLHDPPLPPRAMVSPRQDLARQDVARQEQPRSSRGKGAGAVPDVPTTSPLQRAVLGLASLASLALLVAYLLAPATGPRVAPPVAASPVAGIGRVGSKVRLKGKVLQTRGDLHSIVIRTEGGQSAWVQFLTLDVTRFGAGSAVEVEGILKEVRPDAVAVIHGFTAGPI